MRLAVFVVDILDIDREVDTAGSSNGCARGRETVGVVLANTATGEGLATVDVGNLTFI